MLSRCIEQIQCLDVPEFSSVSKDKTEIIIVGATEERITVSAQLHSAMLKTTNQSRILGVIMDSVCSHTKTITKSAYYQIKNKSGIKGLTSQQEMEKCVHAFILVSL